MGVAAVAGSSAPTLHTGMLKRVFMPARVGMISRESLLGSIPGTYIPPAPPGPVRRACGMDIRRWEGKSTRGGEASLVWNMDDTVELEASKVKVKELS